MRLECVDESIDIEPSKVKKLVHFDSTKILTDDSDDDYDSDGFVICSNPDVEKWTIFVLRSRRTEIVDILCRNAWQGLTKVETQMRKLGQTGVTHTWCKKTNCKPFS